MKTIYKKTQNIRRTSFTIIPFNKRRKKLRLADNSAIMKQKFDLPIDHIDEMDKQTNNKKTK
ncbi:hypothetical protein DERP_001911 [Dermatophagoides pteronyssinus]|uniref:Uncharacterized protein n=1 Tax=Dermatophagoides pteronyssinus TaxID=6956 RepID=A0ABQ8JBX3_DERPT|nr:hypothetical protein DERP_001911 [Dermatophagoides pteronyssinus]